MLAATDMYSSYSVVVVAAVLLLFTSEIQTQHEQLMSREPDILHFTPRQVNCHRVSIPYNVTAVATKRFVRHVPFVVHLQDDIVSNNIRLHGGWDEQTLQWSVAKLDFLKQKYPGSEPVFIDIGHNVGWFSIHVALKGYDVIAFDAWEGNRNCLKTTVCLNFDAVHSKIRLVEVGLSDVDTVCDVYYVNGNFGNCVLDCSNGTGINPFPGHGVKNGRTFVRRLDGLIRKGLVPVPALSIMKIDVEGMETRIFKGAAEFLAGPMAPKFIRSEVVKHRGVEEQFKLMGEYGYRVFLDEGKELLPSNFSNWIAEMPHIIDVTYGKL